MTAFSNFRSLLLLSLFINMFILAGNIFSGLVHAQSFRQDSVWLAECHFVKPEFSDRKVKFLTSRSSNVLVKYNPVSLTFGGLMYFYQAILSPQIASNCAYKISCSNFSKICIHEYGFVKGVALSADRLIRCTQFAVFDIDKHDIDYAAKKINDEPGKYKLKQ